MDSLKEIALIILTIFLSGITFIFYLKWNKISFLNRPLDMYTTLNGRRIFGDNKTLKGPLFMSFFTSLYGTFIYSLFGYNHQLGNIYSIFLSFCLVGLSYSLGELPNSFIKRRIGIEPGKKALKNPAKTIFYVVDIFDSLIAVGLTYLLFFRVQLTSVILAILFGGLIHILTDELMKKFKLKE